MRWHVALLPPILALGWVDRADACGGFFCSTVPVVQTGEQIIFRVDEVAGTMDLVVNITYSGAATDFSWVLPLPSAPLSQQVGSSLAMSQLAQVTSPQFRLSIDQTGRCGFVGFGSSDASAASDAGAGPGVEVISRDVVGPYESVVLQGSDPEEIRTWLTDNGFRVTDRMIEAVVPYLATQHVLLALKLKKDNDVGDLEPIHLVLRSTEPCVPIRLTAIAAQADMGITVYILGSRRAVPQNYLHVELNEARLDWLSGGSNYRQLVAQAADEAGGNAFITEYAGPTPQLQLNLISDEQLASVATASTVGELAVAAGNAGLLFRPQYQSIVRRHLSDDALRARGIDPEVFWRCPNCYFDQIRDLPIDGAAIAIEVRQRITDPDRRLVELFRSAGYLTRMSTYISPEEMNLDPTFVFNDRGLPDVSNIHGATLERTCDGDRIVQSTLILSDGTRVDLGGSGGEPAAGKVEDLNTGRVVSEMGRQPSASQCNCRQTETSGGGFATLALAGLALLGRRRHR